MLQSLKPNQTSLQYVEIIFHIYSFVQEVLAQVVDIWPEVQRPRRRPPIFAEEPLAAAADGPPPHELQGGAEEHQQGTNGEQQVVDHRHLGANEFFNSVGH